MKLSSRETIVEALSDAAVPYLIAGGLAVAARGYGRATFDVDLVTQLQTDNVLRAIRALESRGYRPLIPVSALDFADPRFREIRERWIRDKGQVMFQLHSDQHPETRIDLFVTESFEGGP